MLLSLSSPLFFAAPRRAPAGGLPPRLLHAHRGTLFDPTDSILDVAAERPLLLNRLRPIDAPCLAPSLGLRTQAAKSALRVALALQALRRQLVSELVDCNADLLGNRTLDGDLLCELSEHRDDLVCRNVGACLAGEGAQERIGANRALPLTLEVGIRPERARRERVLDGRILQERVLREGICLSAKLSTLGKLLAESALAEFGAELGVAEVGVAVICARLPEQARVHLRQPRRLQAGKLRYEALRGILRGV